MTISTAEKLNRLNRRFYEEAAEQFSETRQSPWEGWNTLANFLQQSSAPLKVLDVGCGNGRFGVFLQNSLNLDIAYYGTDASRSLLDHARTRLPKSATLIEHDLLESVLSTALPRQSFDLVALYGVLHHVYSFEKRIEVLCDAGSRVRANGLLALSLWQWKEHPRLSRRIVPWSVAQSESADPEGLLAVDPEQDDFLLRWGKDGHWMRYCHHFSDKEVERIVASLGWECISDTQGEGGLNRYLVLRVPSRSPEVETAPKAGTDPGSSPYSQSE